MAIYKSLYTCHEIELNSNCDFVKAYETNLPHNDEIIKNCSKIWNDMHTDRLNDINKLCDNRIESCKMGSFRNSNNETTLAVSFVAKPGKQLTSKIKHAINDYMEGQWCDGIGESFFGPVFTDKNGNKYQLD